MVRFDNANNNDSIMDLSNSPPPPQGGSGKVKELDIEGYTGKIKLRRNLRVDILKMTSGTITRETTAVVNFSIVQDNASSGFDASSWTGGEIGIGSDVGVFYFNVIGSQAHPMTFNVGDATTTPTCSASVWDISKYSTVNWDNGNIVLRPQMLIRDRGVFFARSSGVMGSPMPKWHFIIFGDLILIGSKQLKHGDMLTMPGSNVFKRAAGGIPGSDTAEIDGDVIQEGNLEIDSGTIYVTGMFTQQRESSSDPLPQTTITPGTYLTVDGDFNQTDGITSVDSATLIDHGNVSIALAGLIAVYNSAGTGSSLSGDGNLANNGTIAFYNSGGTIAISGSYQQASTGALFVFIDANGTDNLLALGTATLDGAVTVTRDVNYRPASGSFTFLQYAAYAGDFSQTSYNGNWGGDVGGVYRFVFQQNAQSYEADVQRILAFGGGSAPDLPPAEISSPPSLLVPHLSPTFFSAGPSLVPVPTEATGDVPRSGLDSLFLPSRRPQIEPLELPGWSEWSRPSTSVDGSAALFLPDRSAVAEVDKAFESLLPPWVL